MLVTWKMFSKYIFQEVIQERREQMEKEEVSHEKIWLYVDVGGFVDFNPIQAGWAFSGLLTDGGDLES